MECRRESWGSSIDAHMLWMVQLVNWTSLRYKYLLEPFILRGRTIGMRSRCALLLGLLNSHTPSSADLSISSPYCRSLFLVSFWEVFPPANFSSLACVRLLWPGLARKRHFYNLTQKFRIRCESYHWPDTGLVSSGLGSVEERRFQSKAYERFFETCHVVL
jgi:hypothetical protein